MPYNDILVRYDKDKSIVFRKTKEKYGGLSNMASGYSINLNGYNILSSEALYQSLKYVDSEIQKKIIAEKSPMTAKMISKKYKEYIRDDWDDIKIPVMKWCLRVKLINNWAKFGYLLESTGDFDIVEDSYKDQFWGAKQVSDNLLIGRNYLGRLLKMLREEYREVNCSRNYVLKELDKINLVFMNEKCEDLYINIEDQKKEIYLFEKELQIKKNEATINNSISTQKHIQTKLI